MVNALRGTVFAASGKSFDVCVDASDGVCDCVHASVTLITLDRPSESFLQSDHIAHPRLNDSK